MDFTFFSFIGVLGGELLELIKMFLAGDSSWDGRFAAGLTESLLGPLHLLELSGTTASPSLSIIEALGAKASSHLFGVNKRPLALLALEFRSFLFLTLDDILAADCYLAFGGAVEFDFDEGKLLAAVFADLIFSSVYLTSFLTKIVPARLTFFGTILLDLP